jgi:hypothetical protein
MADQSVEAIAEKDKLMPVAIGGGKDDAVSVACSRIALLPVFRLTQPERAMSAIVLHPGGEDAPIVHETSSDDADVVVIGGGGLCRYQIFRPTSTWSSWARRPKPSRCSTAVVVNWGCTSSESGLFAALATRLAR